MNETRKEQTYYENEFSIYHFFVHYHLDGMVQDKSYKSRKNRDTRHDLRGYADRCGCFM